MPPIEIGMILNYLIHKYLFILFFSEDHNVDIAGLDIAVNAVATAVKDFFFKRLPPVLPEEQMTGMLAHSYHHQIFILNGLFRFKIVSFKNFTEKTQGFSRKIAQIEVFYSKICPKYPLCLVVALPFRQMKEFL